jgi:hypothetical protein
LGSKSMSINISLDNIKKNPGSGIDPEGITCL